MSAIHVSQLSSPMPEVLVPKVLVRFREKVGHEAVLHPEFMHGEVPASTRAQQCLDFMLDDAVTSIVALRGGEGCADCMPFIDAHRDVLLKASPKLMMGFSDFTPMLIYAVDVLGWPAYHGPAVGQLYSKIVPIEAITISKLKAVLDGQHPDVWVDDLLPLNAAAESTSSISGMLTGGNMSLLNISVGDVWMPKLENKIVLIEDWHEKGYQVDRTLKYFARLGWFEQCAAVILGDFEAGRFSKDESEHQEAISILRDRLKRFCASQSCPIFQTRQLGHGAVNYPVPFHRRLTLSGSCLRSAE